MSSIILFWWLDSLPCWCW